LTRVSPITMKTTATPIRIDVDIAAARQPGASVLLTTLGS
jgi:hypothetical protein